jgi:hypothetical protein
MLLGNTTHMALSVSNIVESIEQEIEHSDNLAETFLRAECLLATHYQRACPLLEVFPDLAGETISGAEAHKLQQVLIRFIEALSSHREVTAAIMMLALSKDPKLKEFFITRLRLHLGWRHPTVVFQLMLALEDLGENGFYTTEGHFIGSRSASDTDTNFEVATRYLAAQGSAG